MTGRALPEEDLRALKTAFMLLVRRVGGLAAAEACTRVSDSQLARYYDQADLSTSAPIDVVAQLEAVAGERIVTAELARLGALRLAPMEVTSGAGLAASVARFARHAGEVPAVLCESLADGHLSPVEAAEISRRAVAGAHELLSIAAEAQACAARTSPAAPAVKGEGAPARRPAPPAGGGGRQPIRGGSRA